MPEPIDAERKYVHILAALRQAIRSGLIGDGQVILEGPIARIFTSSRSPVRKALSVLEEEGTLRRFEGRGLVVGSPRVQLRRGAIKPEMFGLQAPIAVRRRNWHELYEKVEHDLLTGSISHARKINESELARFYAIGRSVAGRMLTRAETNGIIRRDNAGRWMTVALDAERVRKLFVLRNLLEPEALTSVAANRVNHQTFAKIEERLALVLPRYPHLSPAELRILEYDLHVKCIELNENEAISRALYETRCTFIVNMHAFGDNVPYPTADPLILGHLTIIRAMRRRTSRLLRKAIRDHLEAGLQLTLDHLAPFERATVNMNLPYLSP